MQPSALCFLQRKVLLELRKLYVRNLAGRVSRREQLTAQIQVGSVVLQVAQVITAASLHMQFAQHGHVSQQPRRSYGVCSQGSLQCNPTS